MELPPVNYRREFWKSPHHAWLALLTLGAGFLTVQPLFLLLGATAYALGLIYMPDLGFFRRWVDKRRLTAEQALAQAQVKDFLQRREQLLRELPPYLQDRYRSLATVCRDIVKSKTEAPSGEEDPRAQRLEELMWTFLRMLNIEGSLRTFLETERRENLPERIASAHQEIQTLSADIEKLKAEHNDPALETKQRLCDSRLEYLRVLERRLEQVEQAKANLQLVVSEQERLDQQIKLIRADSIAVKSPAIITARIDATVETLTQTNRWLAEMDQFKDLVGDGPPQQRVGFEIPEQPPVIQPPTGTSPEAAPRKNPAYAIKDRRSRGTE